MRQNSWLFALALAFTPLSAQGRVVLDVSVDLTPLASFVYGLNGGGPSAIDFELTGGHLAHQHNTVIISDLAGLTAVGTPTTTAGVGTGSDLSSSIILDNTGGTFLADFHQAFVTGNLSFQVEATTNFAGTTPDNFSFAISDRMDIAIGTSQVPSTLFHLNLTPDIVLSHIARTTQSGRPVIGPPRVRLVAHTQPTTVPEPETAGLGLVGLGIVVYLRRPRRIDL